MDVDGAIEQIASLVRELVADAERRGEQRALDRIRAAIGATAEPRAPEVMPTRLPPREPVEATDGPSGRKRAPRGSVGGLIDRSLAPGDGLTIADIAATAQTDVERMIAGTSIRAHLKKGEAIGLYREEGGLWYASGGRGPEAVDRPESADAPPADFGSRGEGPN